MGKTGGGVYFGGYLLAGIAFCFLCGLAAYLTLFRYTPGDEAEYRRLMMVSNPTLAGNAEPVPYTARQKRFGVQKDFSYVQGGIPLHVLLLSKEAELILDRQDDSTQVIEEMHGIKVYMQEELFYTLPDGQEVVSTAQGGLRLRNMPQQSEEALPPLAEATMQPMQIVRYLEAESGSFSYKSDRCTAKNVLVERYVMPGHSLVQSFQGGRQISKGIAEAVEFTMSGEDPQFTAKQLKATVFVPGRM